MRTLSYTGRAGVRRLGPADGLTVAVEFPRGVPTEVADANADLILGDPERFGAFTEGEPTEAVPPPGGDAGTTTEED